MSAHLKNLAEILEMSQCNIMEVEFPSPIQQCISDLQQIAEDTEDKENEDNGDQELDNRECRTSSASGPESETSVLSSIAGSGLFPIPTLANHDCDPNASIEFLCESNQG